MILHAQFLGVSITALREHASFRMGLAALLNGIVTHLEYWLLIGPLAHSPTVSFLANASVALESSNFFRISLCRHTFCFIDRGDVILAFVLRASICRYSLVVEARL